MRTSKTTLGIYVYSHNKAYTTAQGDMLSAIFKLSETICRAFHRRIAGEDFWPCWGADAEAARVDANLS